MRTALCKVNTCDNTKVTQDRRNKTTKVYKNTNWISADVQALIEPPRIPLIKVELDKEK